MDISKEDIVRINKGFGGHLVRSSSIDFILDRIKNKKLGAYKKLAYLWRAILVDHPFSDGNKRTVAFLTFAFATQENKIVDRDLLIHHIKSVASRNENNIKNIGWRLKSCIK